MLKKNYKDNLKKINNNKKTILGKKNVMSKKKERKQKKMWKKKKYGVGKATVISPSLRVLLIMLFLKWYVEPETPWTHHLNDISEEFRKKKNHW